MGESLLLALNELMGQGALGNALGEIQRLELAKKEGLGEELGEHGVEDRIYELFLEYTPFSKRAAFRTLYGKLHGGPYSDPSIDYNDEHGDDGASATEIAVGDITDGRLSYSWDFDYFRFDAVEGEVYQFSVAHKTLTPISLDMFGADGETKLGILHRARRFARVQLIWVAPESGEYYFAVQNFGGRSGQYELSLREFTSEPDDHGDTPATATTISLGDVINGSIDYSYDIDIFRVEVTEGTRYGVGLRPGTLDGGRVKIYTPDYGSRSGANNISWPARYTGFVYYVVFPLGDGTGTYTLTA